MERGKPPHLFWNWWNPATDVQVWFSSREAMLAALIAISRGILKVYLFDGAVLETSCLALKICVVQHRGMCAGQDDDTEILYAGVHAATRARNHFHLFIKGFNHLTYLWVKTTYGHTVAGDPDLLEKALLERLRTIDPDLIKQAVECVCRDTAQEEAAANVKAGASAPRIEGKSLGGTGMRAWFWGCGMLIFCTPEAAPALAPVFIQGLDADGEVCVLLPHQPPTSLQVTWVNTKKPTWTGAHKAKGKAREVSTEEFTTLSLDDFAALLEIRLPVCHSITLPADGEGLHDQPLEQEVGWPTLRQVLHKHNLPDRVTWQDVVEHFVNQCTEVDRVDLEDGSDDRCLLEDFNVRDLSRSERAQACKAAGINPGTAASTRPARDQRMAETSAAGEESEHEEEEQGRGLEERRDASGNAGTSDLSEDESVDSQRPPEGASSANSSQHNPATPGSSEKKAASRASPAKQAGRVQVKQEGASGAAPAKHPAGAMLEDSDDEFEKYVASIPILPGDKPAGAAARGAGAAQGGNGAAGSADPPGLNNSMDMGEVAEVEEDPDVMHMQLTQAQELTKQHQMEQQLLHVQATQLQQLQRTHGGALQQPFPEEQRMQMEQGMREEQANLVRSHELQIQQMHAQHQHQRRQHEEVLRGLRAAKLRTCISPKQGGQGGQ